MTATEFAYAQARIQSRYAERLDEAQWGRLHASSTLAQFLVLARASGLRRWVAHLGPTHGPHELERSLRADYHAHVVEVASWLPERWRNATQFVAGLPLVPFVAVSTRPSGLSRSLPNHGELSSLEKALHSARDGGRLLEKWLSRWRSLWPRTSPSERCSLQSLSDALASHWHEMASADGKSDGWLLRAELERRLLRLFRSQREQPASAFCHLALTALELERLRGALVRRALFQDVRSDVAWV